MKITAVQIRGTIYTEINHYQFTKNTVQFYFKMSRTPNQCQRVENFSNCNK